MGTSTHTLYFVLFLGLVHHAVGTTWYSPHPFIDGFQHEGRRHARAATDSSDPCESVVQCTRETHSVLSHFYMVEIFSQSTQWCHNSQGCWRDGCNNASLQPLATYYGRVRQRICETQKSFMEAFACFDRPLGYQMYSCQTQAHHQLGLVTANSNPVAYANYYLVCVHDLIDAESTSCRREDREFIKSFIDFGVWNYLEIVEDA